MSYGLGIKVEEGLIFAADHRTNAGIDQVSASRKMHVFERAGERFLVLITAGNLSITQALLHRLTVDAESAKRDSKVADASLLKAPSLFACAEVVGHALRDIERNEAAPLARHGVPFDVSLILGGQIKGEKPKLFLIYPPGNFIEAADEAPYVQIGERKYGKPILDRTLTFQTPLATAAKAALLSYDATIRSNASVGLPIDLLAYVKNSFGGAVERRMGADDPYLRALRVKWGESLARGFAAMPEPDWITYRLKNHSR
jgi:putative proteasome-type protease